MVLRANTSQLRRLGAELRAVDPEVYKRSRSAIREVARDVAADAKNKASWSTRIPETVRVSSQSLNTAVVRAGGPKAPHARPYEHAGRHGNFRHPVHGSPMKTRSEWAWVTESARPFLHPAALEKLPELVARLGAAVVSAVDEIHPGGE